MKGEFKEGSTPLSQAVSLRDQFRVLVVKTCGDVENLNPRWESLEERLETLVMEYEHWNDYKKTKTTLANLCLSKHFDIREVKMIHALGVKCDIINNPWAQSRLSTLYAYSPFIGYVLSLECVSRNKTMKKHNPYRFYNGLLAAQGFSQSPEAAEVLLREMVRLRLAPTKVTFLAESSRQRYNSF